MRYCIVALATGALLLAPPQLPAQQRAWAAHVAGGLSLPSGSLNTDFNTGWHVMAGGWWISRTQAWGLRVEGSYNRFGLAATRQFEFGGPSERTAFSLTASGTYRFPVTNQAWRPYAIAGLGSYWTSCTDTNVCGSSTDLGWNLGAGARMMVLGMQGFLELRYHTITDRGNYFPLTFGISF